MSTMNWVDLIILAIFVFSILTGLGRGFVREILSLITLFAAFIIATMFANSLANAIMNYPFVQSLLQQFTSSSGLNAGEALAYVALGLSYAMLFAGTVFIGSFVSYFFNAAFQAGVLGIGNRLFGAAFGFCRGFLIVLVLIFVVQLTPFGDEAWWHQSHFVAAFQPGVQWLAEVVAPTLVNLKSRFGQTFHDVNSSLQGITNFGR
jgi:membrane protein required for colicin V production